MSAIRWRWNISQQKPTSWLPFTESSRYTRVLLADVRPSPPGAHVSVPGLACCHYPWFFNFFIFLCYLSLHCFSAFLLLSTLLASCALYSASLLTLCLWRESRNVVRWRGSLAFWAERDEWCCMLEFNTYLCYSYRFSVVWDVVSFSLLVPLIHILWSNILIFTGQNVGIKCPIGPSARLCIMAVSHFG